MIRVNKVSADKADTQYYEKEGYYTPGSDEAKEASAWFGRAAKDAGLTGEVDSKVFSNILNGITPDGQVMGRMRNGEREHRAGVDLTFNAPKSVSVVALVVQDDRLIKAHDEAVKDVMAYVQDHLIETRIGKNGGVEKVNAPNIIAGLFRHETSRKLDAHLHTHAVIGNMVKAHLGDKYRALHNDLLSNNSLLLSQLYHNTLYEKIKTLGFDVEMTRKGRVKINGLDKLPDLFSKRSKQIAEALRERGLEPSGENKQKAALMTRNAKRNADRRDLDPIWAKEAEGVGWTKERRDAFVADAKTRAQGTEKETGADRSSGPGSSSDTLSAAHDDAAKGMRSTTRTESAREAVDFAIRHISEREALYAVSDLKTVALLRLQTPDLKSIDIEVNRLVESKRLYTVETPKGRYASDDATLTAERDIVRQFRTSVRSSGVEIAKSTRFKLSLDKTAETAVTRRLDRTILSAGQKDAIKLALLGEGRFVGIQGYAGTGKTTMMEYLNKYAERYGYSVEGLAPTRSATGELGKFLPSSNTIRSKVLDVERLRNLSGDPAKTILIIDEASMVSTQDMQTLMRHTNEVGYARVVLLGDIKQLESPEAGIPYRSLQRAGMVTALMDDIRRQTNEKAKAAVIHAMRGEVGQAFEKIAHLKTAKDIEGQVAEEYLSRSKDARKETGVLVMTNAARVEINEKIRDGLRAEGTLTGKEVEIEVINPLHFTRAQSGDAGSYREGDTLISVFSLKSQDISAQDVLTVLKTDTAKNRIEVRNEYSGQIVNISLGQNTKAAEALVAFSEGRRAFAAGDLVKFSIHDPDMDLRKGAGGTIKQIDEASAQVVMHSGETRVIPLDTVAGRGMDHAYALTAHAFQGKTIKDIIVGISSSERMATQKALYVGISRAKNSATLVTNNVSKLIGRLSRNSGESLDALENVTKARIEDLGGTYSRDTARATSRSVDVEGSLEILKDRQERDARSAAHRSEEGDPPGPGETKDDPTNGVNQHNTERIQTTSTIGINPHSPETSIDRPHEASQTLDTFPSNVSANGTDGPHRQSDRDVGTAPETADTPLGQNGQNERSQDTPVDGQNGASKDQNPGRKNGSENTPETDRNHGTNKDQKGDHNGSEKEGRREMSEAELEAAQKALEDRVTEHLADRSRGRDERSR